MSGSKFGRNTTKSRRARTIKVAPVTRAIRTVLAGTALALVATGPAIAGNCTQPLFSLSQCAATYAALDVQPVVDLTTVEDDFQPSSVIRNWRGAGLAPSGNGIAALGDARFLGCGFRHAFRPELARRRRGAGSGWR